MPGCEIIEQFENYILSDAHSLYGRQDVFILQPDTYTSKLPFLATFEVNNQARELVFKADAPESR